MKAAAKAAEKKAKPAPAGCTDKKLPVNWSQNGLYECDWYEGRGKANCGHATIKEACCFCQKSLTEIKAKKKKKEKVCVSVSMGIAL